VVFPLQHAACVEVTETLRGVFFKVMFVPYPYGNMVLYSGPEETVPAVAKLIEELDVPVGGPKTPGLVMIPLQHRRADEVYDQLGKMLGGGRDVRISADKSQSMILVSGGDAVADSARRIIQELDKPRASASLEFVLFRADPSSDPRSRKIPPDLAPATEELQRFGALELMGRMTAVAVEHEVFAVVGGISKNLSYIRLRGELISASADGSVWIRVTAKSGLDIQKLPKNDVSEPDSGDDKPKPLPPQAGDSTFELETTVRAERGHYIVVGSAPSGWAPGESLVLVMYVRP
jgi:hypothetical protein